MAMSKEEALRYANGSVNELARILGIKHPAVSQWSDVEIPELRERQLLDIGPVPERVAESEEG